MWCLLRPNGASAFFRAILSIMKLFTIILFFLSLTHVQAYRISGVTVGVNTTTGQRPFRQEIVQTEREDYPTFVLLILAVQKMLAADQNDPLSWYQLAGIRKPPFPSDRLP